jgi:hypothetical protein
MQSVGSAERHDELSSHGQSLLLLAFAKHSCPSLNEKYASPKDPIESTNAIFVNS